MASAIRTRSRRNGLSLSGEPHIATNRDINSTSPKRAIRRKRARETSDDIDELGIEAKRAKLKSHLSPVRHERNRLVASTKNSGSVISTEVPKPHKKQHSDEPHRSTSPNHIKPPIVNGVNGKRERAPISFSDKQVIAQAAHIRGGGEGDSDGKRKLRSEQGAHYKSELAAYFNEYDEVIGNVVKESQLLSAETQISLVDEIKSKPLGNGSPLKRKATTSPSELVNGDTSFSKTSREYPDSLFSDFNDTKHFDLGFHLHKPPPSTDPLADSWYEPAHRRLTRSEKSVRNQDKDRAQHEKDRVIQLLDGLKGHDWLKVLGVTGITEGKKKEFEGARNYFIGGCENIIERFRLWKEEEKRRKLEKDKINTEVLEEENEEEQDEDDLSDGDPPDYSDVDASAARQLHDEAVARMAASPKRTVDRYRIPASPPFKSFFDKPRVREASLRKNKRSTRSEIQAFGRPIPDLEVRDFQLDEETIKDGEAARRERAGRKTRSMRKSGENL